MILPYNCSKHSVLILLILLINIFENIYLIVSLVVLTVDIERLFSVNAVGTL